MSVFATVLMVIQIVSALVMIGLILMQHGKGADAGAAFGGGGSASLFGATGGANFMSRSTAAVATVFLVATLGLSYFGSAKPVSSGSVLEGQVAPVAPAADPASAPAAPATAPANQIPGQ